MFRKKDMRRLLLVTQGHHGIDTHRMVRRKITGGESDKHQQESHTYKSERVERAYSKKETAHQSRSRECGNDSNTDTCRCQPSSMTENESQNIAAMRAKRHADTYFVTP